MQRPVLRLLLTAALAACGSSSSHPSSGGPDASDDGAAQPGNPYGLAYDGAGNLYFSDDSKGLVGEVVLATGAVSTIASAAPGIFDYPAGLVYDPAGVLYFGSSFLGPISKLTLATGSVEPVAGSDGNDGFVDGVGAAAKVNSPTGLALDGNGNLYAAETDNCAVRKVVLSTTAVTTLAGAGCGSNGGLVDGVGKAAHFSVPDGQGLAYDGAGDLYVADTGNRAIRKIVIATATVTTVTASLAGPTGLAFDGAGALYIADAFDTTIRKLTLSTGALTLVAGTAGTPGDADGTGAAAQFRSPYGLALDGSGNLYVAEHRSGTIRKIVLSTGVVTTVARVP